MGAYQAPPRWNDHGVGQTTVIADAVADRGEATVFAWAQFEAVVLAASAAVAALPARPDTVDDDGLADPGLVGLGARTDDGSATSCPSVNGRG